MLRTILILQIICLFAFCQSIYMPTIKTWNYEFVSLSTNSSDETLLKFNIKLKRISKGIYGLNGTLYINFDVEEGDGTMIETNVYRSVTGSSEYKPTPFNMKKTHLFNLLNTFYKDVFMESLAECSNLPQFGDKFQPPLEKKTYELNNCRASNDRLPPVLAEGYYKAVSIGTGPVDYKIELIIKVENDI